MLGLQMDYSDLKRAGADNHGARKKCAAGEEHGEIGPITDLARSAVRGTARGGTIRYGILGSRAGMWGWSRGRRCAV